MKDRYAENSGRIYNTASIEGDSEEVKLRFDWETLSTKARDWEDGFWIWNYA